MNSNMVAFPPHKSHPSQPVSTDVALKLLQAYLEASSSSPHLLPNATLQATGPTAQSDISSNLSIHNLQRVEAGLRGEWLAPSFELDEGAPVDAAVAEIDDPMAGVRAEEEKAKRLAEEGWQDLDEYQREQSDVEGEVAPRSTAIGQEGEQAVPMEVEVEVPERIIDKDARKAAKKAKRDQEKKDRGKKKSTQ
jgi:hypothetical protein